jgi:heat shock protein HslJ
MMLLAVAVTSCKTSQKSAKEEKSPLCGVQWNLISIEGLNVENLEFASQPCIIFYDNGNFSGNFGCNTFFGEYFQKKNKMELTYKGSTKKLCNDMELERKMMKALKKEIRQYEIDGKTLILYEGKDEVLRFEDSGIRVEDN